VDGGVTEVASLRAVLGLAAAEGLGRVGQSTERSSPGGHKWTAVSPKWRRCVRCLAWRLQKDWAE
jgi:hypothetical protein